MLHAIYGIKFGQVRLAVVSTMHGHLIVGVKLYLYDIEYHVQPNLYVHVYVILI